MTTIALNDKPSDKAKTLLEAAKKKLGMVPNLFKVLSHSPAALESYLNQSGALSGGVLSPKLREQIALSVAGINGCDYCASAHTAIGKGAGLDAKEAAHNVKGESSDANAAAALTFARAIVSKMGRVSDADMAAIRKAGYGEPEIVEIIAVVSMNIFTNYMNHIAGTEIDFPLVETKDSAKAA